MHYLGHLQQVPDANLFYQDKIQVEQVRNCERDPKTGPMRNVKEPGRLLFGVFSLLIRLEQTKIGCEIDQVWEYCAKSRF